VVYGLTMMVCVACLSMSLLAELEASYGLVFYRLGAANGAFVSPGGVSILPETAKNLQKKRPRNDSGPL